MGRFAVLFAVFWTSGAALNAQEGAKPEKKTEPKKLPDKVARLFEISPDQFLQVFDKNKNEHLDRVETPKFLIRAFEDADGNRDGKLDRMEIAALQRRVRGVLAGKGPAPSPEQIVAGLLKRHDKDGDGKISAKEAEERLAKAFPLFDRNKDEFLDRMELAAIGAKMAAAARQNQGPERAPFPGKADPWDFDALDRNADGRLTPGELQETPHESRFDAIDADRNGRIDPREFEAYREKQEKK